VYISLRFLFIEGGDDDWIIVFGACASVAVFSVVIALWGIVMGRKFARMNLPKRNDVSFRDAKNVKSVDDVPSKRPSQD
jgi:hypothetical protein